MKKFQNLILLALIIALVAYTIWDKLAQKSSLDYDEKFFSEQFNIDIPDKIDFAGEPVPLKEPDIRERFDREMHINIFWHANTTLIIKRANRWFPQIEKILEQKGIPADFKYLVVIESALENVISPAKATGFWQIMETTGLELGLEINEEVDERYDPIKSTYAACKYLQTAYQELGNWTLTAAAYNMGISGVLKTMEKQKAFSYYDLELNRETARYVFRALAFKEIFENQEKYGFQIKPANLYEAEKLEYIEVSKPIPDLVDFALSKGISYKNLKVYNPWLRKETLSSIEPGKVYTITIPKELKDEEKFYVEEKAVSEEGGMVQ